MGVSASMTARDNLIIILMWDVMNNSRHARTHRKNAHECAPCTHRGQYICIHYTEQHITMPASMSATEVNALHSAAGKLAWIPVQSLPRLFLEFHDDTKSVAAQLLPALTADAVASWSGATSSPNCLCLASRC